MDQEHELYVHVGRKLGEVRDIISIIRGLRNGIERFSSTRGGQVIYDVQKLISRFQENAEKEIRSIETCCELEDKRIQALRESINIYENEIRIHQKYSRDKNRKKGLSALVPKFLKTEETDPQAITIQRKIHQQRDCELLLAEASRKILESKECRGDLRKIVGITKAISRDIIGESYEDEDDWPSYSDQTFEGLERSILNLYSGNPNSREVIKLLDKAIDTSNKIISDLSADLEDNSHVIKLEFDSFILNNMEAHSMDPISLSKRTSRKLKQKTDAILPNIYDHVTGLNQTKWIELDKVLDRFGNIDFAKDYRTFSNEHKVFLHSESFILFRNIYNDRVTGRYLEIMSEPFLNSPKRGFFIFPRTRSKNVLVRIFSGFYALYQWREFSGAGATGQGDLSGFTGTVLHVFDFGTIFLDIEGNQIEYKIDPDAVRIIRNEDDEDDEDENDY